MRKPGNPKSKKIIDKKEIHITAEVAAEVVYVLEKVYEVPRTEITDALLKLFAYPNISTPDTAVLNESLKIYSDKSIDFVDAILVSYNRIHNHVIHTFDKKVLRLCKQK